ncbi:hypothetical protein O181_058769 [Austropuccinia psidii MF-1]|uniref:EamA domain-containing protein n=1 Tax=Austropuccinia psidii MF-1 TaxID=1389203 RepID=A0A9Q3HXZ4_9BASI|nr:hypothetical protein [Austropuccinia psidii MF-1]
MLGLTVQKHLSRIQRRRLEKIFRNIIMDVSAPPSPPSHSHSNSPQKISKEYLLGIALLLVVVALWVGSSFLMSSMFRDESWNQPWLVTYICTSSFTLYLIRPAIAHFRNCTSSIRPASLAANQASLSSSNRSSSPSRGVYVPLEPNDQNANSEPSRRWLVARAFSVPEAPLTTKETAHLAATFVLLWFAANWTVNAALGYTSVSSTTILSSMSGFFTLAVGVALGAEKFSFGKLVAVGLSITGVILVSKSDRDTSHTSGTTSYQQWILGDILSLSSAALYALYVVLMKVKVRDESRVDMQLFFGFVGAINMICFWPIGVLLHYTGVEPFVLPRTNKLWLSVMINAACTFVSDYIYMLAMLKTSPLVVTLGISLTLPIAVIGDIFKGVVMQTNSFLGAALVLSSFVILSVVEEREKL